MTSPQPPVEPILTQVRPLLADIRAAEKDLDFARVANLSRQAINALNVISDGAARDALQDVAFQALVAALERLDQYDNALDAIALWQARTKTPESLIESQIVLGRILSRQAHFDRALNILDEAVSRAEGAGYVRGLGNASRMKANVYWTMGRSEQAMLAGQQALTIFQQLGDPVLLGQAHLTIAAAEHYLGRFYPSIQNNRRATHFFETAGERYPLAVAYNNLGESYQQLYDMANALKYHELARDILGDTGLSIDLMRNLGVDLVGGGRVEEGLAYLDQALARVRDGGEHDIFLQVLHSLATVHHQLGNIPEARTFAEELLQAATRIDAVRHVIRAMLVLGYCARACGQDEQAHEYFHEGFMAAQRAADTSIIWQTHRALADLLAERQPAIAQVHRRIALEMVRGIAALIDDEPLRLTFQQAAPIHDLLGGAD